jgi:hypothetical protein
MQESLRHYGEVVGNDTTRSSGKKLSCPNKPPSLAMNDFDLLLPNFSTQCGEMNRVPTPIAFVLLAIGIVSSTVTARLER